MPPIQADTIPMQGGIDLVSPDLSAKPGACSLLVNAEQTAQGLGYEVVRGTERFDGRSPAPHDFQNLDGTTNINGFRVLQLAAIPANFLTDPLPLITGSLSGATGYYASATAGAAPHWIAVSGHPPPWNSSDKDADVTLSKSDSLAVASALGSVRGVKGRDAAGDHYFEVYLPTDNSWIHGHKLLVGIGKSTAEINNYPGFDSDAHGYFFDGDRYTGGVPTAYGATFAKGDVIGVRLNAGVLTFYKNGVSQGTAVSGLTGTWYPMWGGAAFYDSGERRGQLNTGRDAFLSLPSGSKAWTNHDFQVNDVLSSSLGTVGTVTALDYDPGLLEEDAARNAAEILRDKVMGPVPGTGAVRGVAILNNTVFAWRNNGSGTAMAIHKAIAYGWSEITLPEEVSFTAGSSEYTDGETLTQGGVSATIKRVVLESGAWSPTNTAAGRFIITGRTGGNFVAGGSTGGGTATLSGAEAAITLAPLSTGQVRTVVSSFGGTTDRRLYGCDGVNREFEFDGETLVPLNTGMTIRATAVASHRNHLFFAYKGSLQHSGIGKPYQYTVVTGASEIATGDIINDLTIVSGSESNASLMVTCDNSVHVLYGDDSASWLLRTISRVSGGARYSAQEIDGGVIAFDAGRFVFYRPSQDYGNFSWESVSNQIEPLISRGKGVDLNVSSQLWTTVTPAIAASVLIPGSNKYRAFMSQVGEFAVDAAYSGFDYTSLLVEDTAHAHAADAAPLTPEAALAVQDGAHGQAADAVVLTPVVPSYELAWSDPDGDLDGDYTSGNNGHREGLFTWTTPDPLYAGVVGWAGETVVWSIASWVPISPGAPTPTITAETNGRVRVNWVMNGGTVSDGTLTITATVNGTPIPEGGRLRATLIFVGLYASQYWNQEPVAGLRGPITFESLNNGTTNPSFAPASYGASSGPTVDFGSYFVGQTGPVVVTGTPMSPMAIDDEYDIAFVQTDSARPAGGQKVLSGSPLYNGSVCALFSTTVSEVTFSVGAMNDAGSLTMKAYNADGTLLGSVTSTLDDLSFENLTLAFAGIKGVVVHQVGVAAEGAGFAVDNVYFRPE